MIRRALTSALARCGRPARGCWLALAPARLSSATSSRKASGGWRPPTGSAAWRTPASSWSLSEMTDPERQRPGGRPADRAGLAGHPRAGNGGGAAKRGSAKGGSAEGGSAKSGGAKAGGAKGSSAKGDVPRETAHAVLTAVSTRDAYANLLLASSLRSARLSGQDAALTTELVYGTLRN